MSYATRPGLVTDEFLPFGGSGLTYPKLVEAGFEWISYLTYNPQLWAGGKDYDLAAVKAHGFTHVGVWGVIYARSDFHNGGKVIAEQAVKLGAQLVQVNCEEIYKETRANRLGKAIIDGVRAGGWTGPVDLITYGAPWNPTVNDYNMDEQSFLDTGGAIIPEAYSNESEGYEPQPCKTYLDRLKVPQAQQNYMLGLYVGRRGKWPGSAYVDQMRAARIGTRFSVYMIQHLDQADVNAFRPYIASAVPTPPQPPPQIPDPDVVRASASKILHTWLDPYLAQGKPQHTSICRLADRLVKLTSTQQSAFDEQLLIEELDRVGSPRT